MLSFLIRMIASAGNNDQTKSFLKFFATAVHKRALTRRFSFYKKKEKILLEDK